jgi:heat shock protein HslJ
MEKRWFMFILMALMMGAAACRTSRQTETAVSGSDKAVSLTGTYWKLINLSGEPVEMKSADATAPHLTLEAGKNSVSGHGGCNVFRGTYERKREHGIRFSGMVLTRKMCLDTGNTEDQLMQAFHRAESCALKSDTLVLYGEGTEELARFLAVPQ